MNINHVKELPATLITHFNSSNLEQFFGKLKRIYNDQFITEQTERAVKYEKILSNKLFSSILTQNLNPSQLICQSNQDKNIVALIRSAQQMSSHAKKEDQSSFLETSTGIALSILALPFSLMGCSSQEPAGEEDDNAYATDPCYHEVAVSPECCVKTGMEGLACSDIDNDNIAAIDDACRDIYGGIHPENSSLNGCPADSQLCDLDADGHDSDNGNFNCNGYDCDDQNAEIFPGNGCETPRNPETTPIETPAEQPAESEPEPESPQENENGNNGNGNGGGSSGGSNYADCSTSYICAIGGQTSDITIVKDCPDGGTHAWVIEECQWPDICKTSNGNYTVYDRSQIYCD